jgi:DNA-binding MarR family transcriptional regulator
MADPEVIYNLLKEIFLLLDDGDRRVFSRYNLTIPRVYALVHLGDQPGMSPSSLSDLMLCDKSNITRIIKSMEADGLVERQAHETDGRTLRLYLTPAGRTVRERVIAAHLAHNQERFDCLDGIGQDNLLEGLLRLKAGLQAQLNIGASPEAPVQAAGALSPDGGQSGNGAAGQIY